MFVLLAAYYVCVLLKLSVLVLFNSEWEDLSVLLCAEREKTKKGDSKWIKTVLTSGTLSDKMAALTVLVQESPAHNLTAIDMLVAMAKKKGKREAMLASGLKHQKICCCCQLRNFVSFWILNVRSYLSACCMLEGLWVHLCKVLGCSVERGSKVWVNWCWMWMRE